VGAPREASGDDGEPLPDHRGDASPAGARASGLSIGQLAARSGLSRSTLLYYDRIGLLKPSRRSRAGYRCYGPADAVRLARICRYRRVGLPLAAIRDLLGAEEGVRTETLAARLDALNEELLRVRAQQRFILELLGRDPRYESRTFMSPARFLALFDMAGISAPQRHQWHAAFEQVAEDEHQAFLEFLCLDDGAIDHIRSRSPRH
jgi:MerR family transcriptional regulator, thiopeptide resistance regulator